MKTNLFLITLSFLAITSLQAQVKKTSFFYGLSTDFTSVPLSEKSLISNSINANCELMIKEKISFSIGIDGSDLKQLDLKQYEGFSGLSIGTGYVIKKDKTGNFSTEINASCTNSFQNFSSFQSFHANLGVRFYMLNFAYLGTGVKYLHNEKASFIVEPMDSYNWYWQMGLRFGIGKKK